MGVVQIMGGLFLLNDASQSFGRHSRVVLAGIQGFQEWMPAKDTLASHSFPLKDQIRVGMLRKGGRGHDGL